MNLQESGYALAPSCLILQRYRVHLHLLQSSRFPIPPRSALYYWTLSFAYYFNLSFLRHLHLLLYRDFFVLRYRQRTLLCHYLMFVLAYQVCRHHCLHRSCFMDSVGSSFRFFGFRYHFHSLCWPKVLRASALHLHQF